MKEFEEYLEPANENCLNWTGHIGQDGRGRYHLNKVEMRAYKAALILAGVEVPENMEIHHLCNNKLCCNINHLVVLSPEEHRRIHNGENNVNNKWSLSDVLLTKYYLHWGYSYSEIKAITGMPNTTIGDIRHGRTWSHINLSDYVCHLKQPKTEITLNISNATEGIQLTLNL